MERIIVLVLHKVRSKKKKSRDNTSRDDCIVSAVVAVRYLLGIHTHGVDELNIGVRVASIDEIKSVEYQLRVYHIREILPDQIVGV